MKSKGILILLILMTLSVSLNFVVATDMNATLSEQISTNVDYTSEGYDDYLNLVNVDDEYQINENQDSYLSSESSKVIYVGNNSGVGEGSFDNPYPNFKSACDNVNGEDNVTINVFAGTYYLGEGLDEGIMTPLRFNVTGNLNIVGNGTVIIKNYFDNPNSNDAEAFSLVSGLANVTFSDIIFDSSSRTVENYASDSWGEYQYFVPFYGETNLATFNNCSFAGSNLLKAFSGASFNSKFVNCSFDCIGEEGDARFVDAFASNTVHVFEYCIVNFGDCIRLQTINLPCTISFDNVWFGQNTLPQYITPPERYVKLDGQKVPGYVIPVSRYAVFDVTENYLGNDQFEIIGKLTWNGTSDQDGMENFQPMTVTLVSDTGDIDSTVSLVNGNFRTVYTSSSDIHRVNATLHNQLIPLEFTGSSGVGESSKVIYVGQNVTVDGGNGSFDNPFGTFKLACDNVNGEDNVTINVFAGTYYLGEGLQSGANSPLMFNVTGNLNIVGNGTVIIKNYFNDVNSYDAEAFSLTSDLANVTFSNIIFDSSDRTVSNFAEDRWEMWRYFVPFYGKTNLATFNNCSFFGSRVLCAFSGAGFNSRFVNCYFDCNAPDGQRFVDKFVNNTYHVFEYCIVNIGDTSELQYIYLPCNISFENVWFGQNTLPRYITPPAQTVIVDKKPYYGGYVIPVSRYAVFNVTENYLGNGQFEIVGKLTWNGTSDQDGMENFQPMTVTLVSDTGDIESTVSLVNGNFRTIYTSHSSNNLITATLHNQQIELNFTTVNITAEHPVVKYGQDQNVTINFSQVITANVTLTVSNESYRKVYEVEVVGMNSTCYTIPDTLKSGTYAINITLSDNKFYGFNTTELTISKYKYGVDDEYKFTAPMPNVKLGENITIIITLPEDANGTVTVKLGNDTQIKDANQTVTFNFTTLNVGDYPVNITYSGDDKYESNTISDTVTVNKAGSSIEIEDAVFTYGDVIAIPFNVTHANGVNVIVYNKEYDEVDSASSTSGIITLRPLTAGEYLLYVETVVVDDNYEVGDAEVNLTINKANSTLEISDKKFAYASEAIINAVTINSTGDLIATLIDENNNEIAVKDVTGNDITLPLLDAGKYTLSVTTNVDENHINVTKSATITIVKTTSSMNVIVEPAENITAKDNVSLTVKLPADATGDVVVKVNGKKLYNVSANETIAINLDNAPGDYVVDVTYSGDKNYEGDMSTKEFTISKAETSITANPIVFEEGNSTTLEVNIPDVDSGFVLVDVAGKKFYGDISGGKATVLIDGIVAGNYTADITFAGNEKFNKTTGNVDVNVTPTVDIISELKEIIKNQTSRLVSLMLL